MHDSFSSPKRVLRREVQITWLSNTIVLMHPRMSRGSILVLGPIWVKMGYTAHMVCITYNYTA